MDTRKVHTSSSLPARHANLPIHLDDAHPDRVLAVDGHFPAARVMEGRADLFCEWTFSRSMHASAWDLHCGVLPDLQFDSMARRFEFTVVTGLWGYGAHVEVVVQAFPSCSPLLSLLVAPLTIIQFSAPRPLAVS